MAGEERPPIVDDDAPGHVISVQDNGEPGEGGKLRMMVGLLKKAFGVKDIAAMRLSLPASLLEPIPNLEYWQYLDRPDLFVAINDSPDPFERLLAVLRFMFSKDIKLIHGRIFKPYNSVLGEFFLAHWDVVPVEYPSDDRTLSPIQHLYLFSPSPEPPNPEPSSPKYKLKQKETLSPDKSSPKPLHSEKSSTKSKSSLSINRNNTASPSLSYIEQNLAAGKSDISLAAPSERSLLEADSLASGNDDTSIQERVRVLFLTEQISHHPPVSAFHCSVPSKGIRASGVDHISARVSGTSVRVSPGMFNKGIFITLDEGGHGAGEGYRITHPVAHVHGMLTGKLYAALSETSIVTIEGGENWRVIVEYKEESWLGAPKFGLEGVIHTIDPDTKEHEAWTKVKHVPSYQVIARLEGSWHSEIRYRRVEDKEWKVLIDLSNLSPIPKSVRPLTQQLPNESRKLWDGVTSNLLRKEFSEATRIKQSIEQAQREEAAARKRKGEQIVPVYFDTDIDSGAPTLTKAGEELLAKEASS